MKAAFRFLSLMLMFGTIVSIGQTARRRRFRKRFHHIFRRQNAEGLERQYPSFWSVKDGVITGRTTKENPTKGKHIHHLDRRHDRRFRTETAVQNHSRQQRDSISEFSAEKQCRQMADRGYQADFEAGKRIPAFSTARDSAAFSADAVRKPN